MQNIRKYIRLETFKLLQTDGQTVEYKNCCNSTSWNFTYSAVRMLEFKFYDKAQKRYKNIETRITIKILYLDHFLKSNS